ncbi:MAG TPA: NADH-quinone oxidoreductase subunit N [Bryobacteraceae bacterium]|nr:NADH-quinone oxidoreductase subunit N [Bryobacteraceae bacterium]
MSGYYTSVDHFVLLPPIMLALFGCAILLFEFALSSDGMQRRRWLLALAFVGLGFTGRSLWIQQQAVNGGGSVAAFHSALIVDGFAMLFNWIFLATSAIVLLISYRYLEIEGEDHAEYYGLVLLAQAGMFFLASGNDLVTLFVGLETMALCFYIMVGFLRSERRSNEAALKYFLLGGFSSGFLAFGFSMLYGLSGSTNLQDIAAAIAQRSATDPLTFLALATTTVGLLFKISAAPFHMWAPDAYEGAPTSVTAYLSVGSKAASFAILLRFFLEPLGPTRQIWLPILIAVSIISLTIGNLAAISQTNIKRLLAYSGVSHAGYMLLGLVAGNETGIKGIAVYLIVYTFMTLGALLVVVAMRRADILGEDIDDVAGLVHRRPVYAIFMLIFLLSLAGIPPTAGFLGKYYIFLALLETGHYALAVIATLYVAVSLYYYFRIVRSMFVREGGPSASLPLASSLGVRVALGITGALTLIIGLFPEPFLRYAGWSVLK